MQRNFDVDETIFDDIPLDFDIDKTVAKIPKRKRSSSKKKSPRRKSDSLVKEESNRKGKNEDFSHSRGFIKFSAVFELVRDEPLPMFQLRWTSKNISFGETFSGIKGRVVRRDSIDFPLHRLDEVTARLNEFCGKNEFKLALNSLPSHVLESFKKPRFSINDKETKALKLEKLVQNLPGTIRNALYSFQKETLLFAVEKEGRILIGDEMGLGKTIQAIALCALFRDDWPVLIIAPSSLKDNWKFELLRWLPECLDGSRVHTLNSVAKEEFPAKKEFDVVVVSYSIAAKHSDLLGQIEFNMIILDECHMLKSKSAQRSRKIVPLAQKARRRVLLSGTATPSRPIELFTQLECLKPPGAAGKKWFLSRTQYSVRYCAGRKVQKGRFMVWDEKGNSNLTELNIMLNREAMIRRLKKDALPHLKAKIRKTYRISDSLQTSPELLAAYSKFDRRKVSRIFEGFLLKDSNAELLGGKKPKLAFDSQTRKKDFMELYKNTGLAKVQAICAFLARKIEKGRKVIVFAHHKDVLDSVDDFLMRQRCGFIRIDGRVPIARRFDLVKQFQRFDYCSVALLSITATGVGITLTAAERVIFAELDFVPARLLQCEDRAHRIGQKKVVKIYYILARKTLDDFVWPLIQRKLQTVSTTLDGTKKASLKINSTTRFENSGLIKEKNLDSKVKVKQTQIAFNK